jgi:ATP-binding cassette subfamily B protein
MQRLIVRLIDSQNPKLCNQRCAGWCTACGPHRLAIAGLLGLSVCASLLVLVQPWLTKLLIDDGLLAQFPDAGADGRADDRRRLARHGVVGINRYCTRGCPGACCLPCVMTCIGICRPCRRASTASGASVT